MIRAPVNLYLQETATGIRRQAPADSAPSEGGLVDAVRPGTPAAAAGIRPGARVMAANGRVLRDVVDYQFYTAEPEVTLSVIEANGEEREYRFEKWPDDDLGLEFAEATWDGVRVCTNTCFFCFLKGLPKAMRRSLYLKDDDYRLSFLHGNFVTLTNLTAADWQRLEEQRLSPLNVSVHATDLALRRRMLGYADAPDIVEQLRRLGSFQIQAHTQVVLCPGVNDGAHLDRTIADLGALHPTVRTISVVPVGATMQFEQRMGMVGSHALDDSRACSPAYARSVVRQVAAWQRRFREQYGASIVHAADEYFLGAGARIPAAQRYDGFPQYENGIGMTRALLDDWRATRKHLPPGPSREHLTPRPPSLRGKGEHRESIARCSWAVVPHGGICDSAAREGASAGADLGVGATSPPPFPRREGGLGGLGLTVACGTLIAPTLARLFQEFEAETGIGARVIAVPNEHFGARINISGLLVGRDIIRTLAAEDLGDVVFLPRTSLDYFGRKFLDDTTPAEVEGALGRPVLFASSMSEVVEQIEALAAGMRPEPATPAVTNGIVWTSKQP